MKNIYKIVLTGGPCSGKTSILNYIRQYYSDFGYKIIVINETATQIIESGISWRDDNINYYEFQKSIFNLQKNKEELMFNLANTSQYDNILILCDRGLLDGKAYIDDESFKKIYNSFGFKDEQQLLNRYDKVICLETTANNKDLSFGNENNKARTSNVDEAKIFDERVEKIWNRHKNFSKIFCQPTFDQKIEQTLNLLISFLEQKNNKEFNL